MSSLGSAAAARDTGVTTTMPIPSEDLRIATKYLIPEIMSLAYAIQSSRLVIESTEIAEFRDKARQLRICLLALE